MPEHLDNISEQKELRIFIVKAKTKDSHSSKAGHFIFSIHILFVDNSLQYYEK